jgi:hypothetical protein
MEYTIEHQNRAIWDYSHCPPLTIGKFRVLTVSTELTVVTTTNLFLYLTKIQSLKCDGAIC